MDEDYYKPFTLTEQGLRFRQEAIAGDGSGGRYTVDFTRAVIGQGRPATEEDMFTITRVVEPVADMPVKASYADGYSHIIIAVVDNTKLTQTIMMTEIGIMARLLNADGSVAIDELLYGYTYTNRYDYLPEPSSGYVVQREMIFDTVISRSANVSVMFDASRIYATIQDVEDIVTHMTDTLVTAIPVPTASYFSRWRLYDSVGGITAPLEDWGFTNATLTEVQSRSVLDINAGTVTVYASRAYAGREWTVTEYQDGIYILTAADKSLILVRG